MPGDLSRDDAMSSAVPAPIFRAQPQQQNQNGPAAPAEPAAPAAPAAPVAPVIPPGAVVAAPAAPVVPPAAPVNPPAAVTPPAPADDDEPLGPAGMNTIRALRGEVHALRSDFNNANATNAMLQAGIDHGLTRDDLTQFVGTHGTAAEIDARAAAFKARLGGVTAPVVPVVPGLPASPNAGHAAPSTTATVEDTKARMNKGLGRRPAKTS